MAVAGLSNTELRLHVPENVAGEVGRLGAELRVGIVQDLYERQAAVLREREARIAELEGTLAEIAGVAVPVEQLTREVAVQYPSIERLSFGRVMEARTVPAPDTGVSTFVVDTVPTVLVAWRAGRGRAERQQDQARLVAWLRVRLGLDTIQIIGS
jgi:hypothetical protein